MQLSIKWKLSVLMKCWMIFDILPITTFCNIDNWGCQVEPRLPRSEKLRNMIKEGIPHSLRPQIWMRISGAYEKRLKSDLCYKDVVKASSNDHLMTSKQIEKVRLLWTISTMCNIKYAICMLWWDSVVPYTYRHAQNLIMSCMEWS